MAENNNAQNRAEVAATEELGVHLTLTIAQAKALKMIGKLETRNETLQGAIDARIKGAFKAYADKAVKHFGKVYDDASIHGAKFPMSKDEFIKTYSSEVQNVMREL